jgi:hypothetical protein
VPFPAHHSPGLTWTNESEWLRDHGFVMSSHHSYCSALTTDSRMAWRAGHAQAIKETTLTKASQGLPTEGK